MNAPPRAPAFTTLRRQSPQARGTSAEGVHIRLMDAPDLAAYKALRDLMLATHPEAFTSDAETELRRPPETYLARIAGAADGGWPFTLTAWHGERLCGAITGERDERVKVRHIGQVVGMMVHPAACRRGIGRALVDACVALARQRSEIEMLTLSVTSSNAGAIRLYERAGFVRYGRLERAMRLGDVYHHKELMVLQLQRET
jgi:ribosomal protein S18 acetylase RimI-like enzyme